MREREGDRNGYRDRQTVRERERDSPPQKKNVDHNGMDAMG